MERRPWPGLYGVLQGESGRGDRHTWLTATVCPVLKSSPLYGRVPGLPPREEIMAQTGV